MSDSDSAEEELAIMYKKKVPLQTSITRKAEGAASINNRSGSYANEVAVGKKSSFSPNKNDSVESHGRTEVTSPSFLLPESSDDELPSIKRIVEEFEEKEARAKNKLLNADLVTQDSLGDGVMDNSSGKNKPKKVNKRAKIRARQLSNSSSESSDEEVIIKSVQKLQNKKKVGALLKPSKINTPGNEKKKSIPEKQKTSSRTKRLNSRSASETVSIKSVQKLRKEEKVASLLKVDVRKLLQSKVNTLDNENERATPVERKTSAQKRRLDASSALEDSAVDDEMDNSSVEMKAKKVYKGTKIPATQFDAKTSKSSDKEKATKSVKKLLGKMEDEVDASLRHSNVNMKTIPKRVARSRKSQSSSEAEESMKEDKESDRRHRKSKKKENQSSQSETCSEDSSGDIEMDNSVKTKPKIVNKETKIHGIQFDAKISKSSEKEIPTKSVKKLCDKVEEKVDASVKHSNANIKTTAKRVTGSRKSQSFSEAEESTERDKEGDKRNKKSKEKENHSSPSETYSEDSAVDDEVDNSSVKMKPKKVNKGTKIHTTQFDATTSKEIAEKSVKKLCGKMEEKVDASVKHSNANMEITAKRVAGSLKSQSSSEAEEKTEEDKEGDRRHKKSKEKENQSSRSETYSEDSAVDDEMDNSSVKTKSKKVNKGTKIYATQFVTKTSKSSGKEIAAKSVKKLRGKMEEKVNASLKHSNANINITEKRVTGSRKSLSSSEAEESTKGDKEGDRRYKKSKEKENENLQSETYSSLESNDDIEEVHPSVPSNKKEYPCFGCTKIFNKTQELFDHTCDTKKEKGFMCKVCKKVYKLRSTYINHQIIHSGKKPYKCLCGSKFSSQSNYLFHTKNQHSECLAFLCQFCDCSFSTRKEQISHHLLHKKVCCKYCDEPFEKDSNLKRHIYKEHERYFKKKI